MNSDRKKKKGKERVKKKKKGDPRVFYLLL